MGPSRLWMRPALLLCEILIVKMDLERSKRTGDYEKRSIVLLLKEYLAIFISVDRV